jgi:hypothetical protein
MMPSGLWGWATAERLLMACAFALGAADYAVSLKMLFELLAD